MANTSVYQSKLKRLVWKPQATLGTAPSLDASAKVIPAYDVSVDRGRGTQIIERSAVMDGFAGSICGAVGSFGSNLSFTAEVHDENEAFPAWAHLLFLCGWEGSHHGDSGVTTLRPSNKQLDDWSGTKPGAGTFGYFTLVGDGVDDNRQIVNNFTGNAKFVINAGERLEIQIAGVGTNDAEEWERGTYTTVGTSGVDFGCAPLICKGIEVKLDGSEGAAVAVRSIEIDCNTATPDVPDPSKPQGFAISPVFWNESPQVSIGLGASDDGDDLFFDKFFAGTSMSLTAKFDAPSGRELEFVIDKIQFTGVTYGNNDGYASYDLVGSVVRSPGKSYADSGNEFKITWTLVS